MGIGDDINTFFNGGYNGQMYDSIIEPIKDALLTAFSSIQTWLDKEFNTITDFIDNEIVGPINEGVNYIKQLPDYITHEANFIKDSIENTFVDLGNSIKDDVVNQVDGLRDDMVNLGDTVTGSFNDIAGNLENTFEDIGNTLYNGIDGIGSQLEGTFYGIFESLVSTFEALGDDLTNIFGIFYNDIIAIGLWLWSCIQYLINCFTCIAYYVQKIFTSFCIIFYIIRLFLLIIWGFVLAFFYLIQKPGWAENILDGIYKANEFILDLTKPIYEGGIDIIGFFYPEECYDCGFSFSDFPAAPPF
jgi:Flp pilus assembly pilin Flp